MTCPKLETSVRRRKYGQSGFTLIETLIVTVVLAIASLTVATLTGHIFDGRKANKELQTGMQLMQECAELILTTSRTTGYDVAKAMNCDALTAFSGFDLPVVTPTPGASNTLGNACPYTSGTKCTRVVISVSSAALGATPSPVTLLLIEP